MLLSVFLPNWPLSCHEVTKEAHRTIMKSETPREMIDMDEKVLLWLLHESDPCARLAALKLLLGKNDADPDVQDARASAMDTGTIGKIL